MLENGFESRQPSQEKVYGGKGPDSGHFPGLLRHRLFCLILLMATAVLLYNTNIMEMANNWSPKWWKADNGPQWRPAFKSAHYMASSTVSTASVFIPIKFSNASSSPSLQSTKLEGEATTVTIANTVTQVKERTILLPTPIPYVSPGPQFVEYPFKYHFIINEPNNCKESKPFLVLVVPVAPQNRAHRDIIRTTWGSEKIFHDQVVNLFFLLGLSSGGDAKQIQHQVLQESGEHHDLLQSDFVDCYKNLTIKTMVMLEWMGSHCSSASYVMKIDSDMFLNVDNLVKMLLTAPKNNYMTGLVAYGGAVLRDPNSKWYLPANIFPEPQYPPYALGLGYVMSLDLARKLVEASSHVKAVYIEDVYLGLCMRYLKIPPTNPPSGNLFHVFPLVYSRCAFSKIIATTTYEQTELIRIWKDFKIPGSLC